MHYYFMVDLTRGGQPVERGWMMATHVNELIRYARVMRCGIDVYCLGEVDTTSTLPKVKD